RIVALFYYPWSWSLDKVSAGPSALNATTVFVACGNLAILAGLRMASRGRSALRPPPAGQRLPHPAIIVLLAVLSFAISEFLFATAPYLFFSRPYLRNVPCGEREDLTLESIRSLQGSAASSVLNADAVFERMFSRAGYLDVATSFVAGRDVYNETLGVTYAI